MDDPLSRLLSRRDHLVADGAIGTNLLARGLSAEEAPETWNVARPEIVTQLHRDFVAAGADTLSTNTFGANSRRLHRVGAAHRVRELNRAGAALARTAAEEAGRPVVVAGVLGPTGARRGEVEAPTARRVFAEQAEALAEGGVDVLWLETFTALAELEAALDGAGDTSLPIVATLALDHAGSTLAGDPPEAVAAFLRTREPRPVAIGTNCGPGPGPLIEALRVLRATANPEILVAKSSCGLPAKIDERLVYPASPEIMACYSRLARDAGARVIGGCCGATPEHVRAITEALSDYTPRPLATPAEVETALAIEA